MPKVVGCRAFAHAAAPPKMQRLDLVRRWCQKPRARRACSDSSWIDRTDGWRCVSSAKRQRDSHVHGMYAAPMALETARQCEMRYNVKLSLTVVNIRFTEGGLSGFPHHNTPYAPAERDDLYIAGANMACCLSAFPTAALGALGPGGLKLDRDVELLHAVSKGASGTFIAYASEHRTMMKNAAASVCCAATCREPRACGARFLVLRAATRSPSR